MTDEKKSIPEVWLAFALKTIELDNNHKKADSKWQGWHWLWAIHRLKDEFQNFNFAQLGNKFDGTRANTYEQFPKASSEPDYFEDTLQNLIKDLGYPKKISKIDFSGLTITEDIDFSNFVFILKTSFTGTKFLGNANFTDADFFKGADFNKTTFSNETFFSRVKISNGANFDDAIFSSSVNFKKAEFHYFDASFRNAKFFDSTSFEDVNFYGRAIFNNAEFSKFSWLVKFDRASFAGLASFSNTKFSGHASFTKTTFSNQAFFNDIEFSCIDVAIEFDGAKFSSRTDFSNTTFFGHTTFHDASFLSYTTFEKAVFKVTAPRFYGATLNDEMFWTDIKLPELKRQNDTETEADYKQRTQINQNAYENLSTKLGKQDKYHDEHFFFRHEMRCRQDLAESFFSFCAFWFYELFSDYGYRIGRVFGWWLGHIALGVLVIVFIAMWGGMRYHESLPCAIPVSFANANPYTFLGFGGSNLEKCYGMLEPLAPTGFAIVKVIQTILGVGLLSLLIITLRTRFRLK